MLSRNLMWTIFKVYIYSNIYLYLYTLLQFSTAYCCFYVLFVPTKSTQKALRTENLNVKSLRRFLGACGTRYAQTVLALIPKNACHFTDFPIAHQ